MCAIIIRFSNPILILHPLTDSCMSVIFGDAKKNAHRHSIEKCRHASSQLILLISDNDCLKLLVYDQFIPIYPTMKHLGS